MWTSDITLLEGDPPEAELIGRFVELSARYPTHNEYDIAAHVFRGLKDPGLRSQQAALNWSRDLGIKERIRLCILNGGTEAAPLTELEKNIQKIQAIADDNRISTKERLAAFRLIAEMRGQIVKPIEVRPPTKDVGPTPVVYHRYGDEEVDDAAD